MNMKLRKALFGWAVLVTVLLYACSAPSGTGSPVWGGLGDPSDQVPLMEKVRTGTLPSGLRYFILENSKPENQAYLRLAVNAGSVLEEDDEQGLAWFVEHMAFNGTARFPKNKLIDYLRSLGMSSGTHQGTNAGFDSTVYGIEVPIESDGNGIRRIPDTALAVIDYCSRAITFAPADIDDERPVIEEYRKNVGAQERLRRQWLPVLFHGSPYAQRLPIGLPEIIETAPASRLEGFYKKWYRADNMALIFVGDFDGEALEASLAEHFLIERPAVPTVRPVYDLPLPKEGVEVLILTDPELTDIDIELHFKRGQKARRGDLSSYRDGIIDILIDYMFNSRFQNKSFMPAPPSVSTGAGTNHFFFSRFYSLRVQAKYGNTRTSLNELLWRKETMLRYGFSDTELAIAAYSLMSNVRRGIAEKDKQESRGYANALVGYFLDGGSLAGLEWELDAIERLLPHIEAKDINAAIKDYFASGDLTVIISAPDSKLAILLLPNEAQVRQIVARSGRMRIAPPGFIITRNIEIILPLVFALSLYTIFLQFLGRFYLKRQMKMLQALAKISTIPALSSGIVEEFANIIVQEACHALYTKSTRVGIWNITEDTTVIKNITCYEKSTKKHIVQEDFDLSNCPEYLQLLKSERVIPINNAKKSNPLSPCMEAYGPNIRALLDAPIRVDGKLAGVVCIEQNRRKGSSIEAKWTVEEQNFASSLADLMTIVISNSERRRLEVAELANRAKSEFLANMSHEINTPLSVISVKVQQAAELFEDGTGEKETIVTCLRRAQEVAMQTALKIEKALRVASMQEYREQKKVLHIDALLKNSEEAYRSMLEERGNKLNLTIADGMGRVYGDADQLSQVMENLLNNANRHTKDGVITVGAESDGGFIKVTVTDSGGGIAPELLPHVFEPGVSGAGSTGMGLGICERIIESHGGTIAVESEPGKGTEVRFTLPVYRGDDVNV